MCKTHGIYGNFAVSGKADTDKCIFFGNSEKTFINSGTACVSDDMNIVKNKTEVMSKKICQRRSRTCTVNIDVLGIDNRVDCTLKVVSGGFFNSMTDFLDILIKHCFQHIVVFNLSRCNLNSLNRGKLILDHFLHSFLQLRITAVADFGCKTDHCAFAYSYELA